MGDNHNAADASEQTNIIPKKRQAGDAAAYSGTDDQVFDAHAFLEGLWVEAVNETPPPASGEDEQDGDGSSEKSLRALILYKSARDVLRLPTDFFWALAQDIEKSVMHFASIFMSWWKFMNTKLLTWYENSDMQVFSHEMDVARRFEPRSVCLHDVLCEEWKLWLSVLGLHVELCSAHFDRVFTTWWRKNKNRKLLTWHKNTDKCWEREAPTGAAIVQELANTAEDEPAKTLVDESSSDTDDNMWVLITSFIDEMSGASTPIGDGAPEASSPTELPLASSRDEDDEDPDIGDLEVFWVSRRLFTP